MKEIRLAVVLARLDGGGIEHCRLRLVKYFISKGLQVDLVVGQAKGDLVSKLPEGLNLIEIASEGRLLFFPGLLKYMLKNRPSHILSAFDDVNVMVVIANRITKLNAQVVLSNHNAYSTLRKHLNKLQSTKYSILQRILRWSFRNAKEVVAVSHGVAVDLENALSMRPGTIKVIYNPIIEPNFWECASQPISIPIENNVPNIVFVGRLATQKRVDLLIRAFKHVKESHKRVRLYIVGEGKLRDELKCLVNELGLGDAVVFCGFLKNPLSLISRCDLLVLSSDFEGLGNVLVEALACGTQVVSTDCPFGPSEVLENGHLGQLVPVGDEISLSNAICRSIDKAFWVEPDELVRSVRRRFTVDESAKCYLKCLGLTSFV